MPTKKTKKQKKVRDLKPTKDAKGGGYGPWPKHYPGAGGTQNTN